MYMIVLRLPGYCRNALHADMHTCSTQTRFDCSVFAYALQWESFSAEIGVVSASCSRTKIETICPESILESILFDGPRNTLDLIYIG